MMEKKKYKLGDYEFDTYEEYLEAQEDLKKIDLITEEVDINDVDVAARLYTRIRNKEIVFHSKVGINFFMYLSDIVANHSMLMVEEKKAAVPEGFRSLRQGGKYDNSNLVNVGRSAGKQAYDNLYISQVKFNFDFTPYWENLVKTRNL